MSQINEIVAENVLSPSIGYKLTLTDPETADVIYVLLDNHLPGIWKITPISANNAISSLMDKTFYVKRQSNPSIINKYTLTSGELNLQIEANLDGVKVMPHAKFVLESPFEPQIIFNFNSNQLSSLDYNGFDFLNTNEYEYAQDQNRVYRINYELPSDTTFKQQLTNLPFLTVWGKTNGYRNHISQTIEPGYAPLGHQTINFGLDLLIVDRITVRGKDFYKAAMDGKVFFIETQNVDLYDSSKLNIFLSQPQHIRNALLDYAKIASRLHYLTEKRNNLKALSEVSKRDFVVLEAHPYDMSEYTDGTGMTFRIKNQSPKTIKYITFKYIGYNAVDDPVYECGKSLQTNKGIGPIAPNEIATYSFEYVWVTDIVTYSNIKSITIQYIDGTTRTFSGQKVKPIPDNIINALSNKSPVASLLPRYSEDE